MYIQAVLDIGVEGAADDKRWRLEQMDADDEVGSHQRKICRSTNKVSEGV